MNTSRASENNTVRDVTSEKKPIIFYAVQILHALLLVLIFLGPTISFPHNRKIQAALSIIVFILTLLLVWKELVFFDLFLIIYCGILIVWTLFILGIEWLDNRHIYHTIASLGLALLLKNRKLYRATIIIPFIFLVALSIFSVLFLKENLSDGRFFYLNRNSFGKILLVYAALIAIFDYYQGVKRPYLWPAFLTLIIGSISKSRGGLGISILYFVFILVINFGYLLKKKTADKKYIINKKIVSVTLITMGTLFSIIAIIILIKNSTFMAKGLSSSGRWAIVESYIADLNLTTFFSGFRPSIYDQYNHMHNSYLTLHSLNGIGAFPAFFGIIALIILSSKKSFLLFGLIGIFCFYALFEHVFFFNIADYIIFPLLLILINKDSMKNKQSVLFVKLINTNQ